jgi:hypothetical protein
MKRLVLRWAVLFVATNVFGFVVHGLLLQGGLCRQPTTPAHTGRRESALRVHAHRIRLFVCGVGLDLRSRDSISALARSRTPLWLCGVDADLASLVPDVLRGSAVARGGSGQANFIRISHCAADGDNQCRAPSEPNIRGSRDFSGNR